MTQRRRDGCSRASGCASTSGSGTATYLSYLEHVFGYGPRQAGERIRVAEALTRLPAMFEALAKGELHWSAVRELTRVAVPATEAEWLAAARGKTVRDVEDMVSGRKRGDKPGDPPDPGVKRHVLRLELSGDALAAFREARRHIELEVGHSLDDDEAVRMLAHCALGGPRDPGRAAYQIAITVCEECGRGTRDGAGRVFQIEPHEVEAACCDAQNIGSHRPRGRRSRPGPRRPSRPTSGASSGGATTGAAGWMAVARPSISRCITSCREPRAARMIRHSWHLLCGAHHRQVHRGVLGVTGNANGRLEFRRADGTRVGEPARVTVAARRARGRGVARRRSAHRRAANRMSANEADAIDALRRLDIPAKHAREAVAPRRPRARRTSSRFCATRSRFSGVRFTRRRARPRHASRARQPTGTYRLRNVLQSFRPACSLDGHDGLGQHRGLHRIDPR